MPILGRLQITDLTSFASHEAVASIFAEKTPRLERGRITASRYFLHRELYSVDLILECCASAAAVPPPMATCRFEGGSVSDIPVWNAATFKFDQSMQTIVRQLVVLDVMLQYRVIQHTA